MSSPYSGFNPGEALVGGQCVSHWVSCQAAQIVLVSSCPSGPGTPRLRGRGTWPRSTDLEGSGAEMQPSLVCPRAVTLSPSYLGCCGELQNG